MLRPAPGASARTSQLIQAQGLPILPRAPTRGVPVSPKPLPCSKLRRSALKLREVAIAMGSTSCRSQAKRKCWTIASQPRLSHRNLQPE